MIPSLLMDAQRIAMHDTPLNSLAVMEGFRTGNASFRYAGNFTSTRTSVGSLT